MVAEKDLMPRLSIITPTLNRATLIGEAVESVMRQGYPNVEHLIMDGGSTDGTLEVLRKYPHLKIVSEPDRGLYDAINKGIRMASGEIIGLLNTDDLYAPNIFGSVVEKFNATGADVVIGGAEIFEETPDGINILDTFLPIPWADENQRWERLTGSVITNAWFFRRRVFSALGLFDPDFHIASDRDFLWRVGASRLQVENLEQVIYCYRSHAGSLTMVRKNYQNAISAASQIKASREMMIIIEKFLKRQKLSLSAKRSLRDWYSENTYLLAFIAAYHFSPRLFCEAFWRGCKNDARWPYYWFVRLTKRLYRELKYHLKKEGKRPEGFLEKHG